MPRRSIALGSRFFMLVLPSLVALGLTPAQRALAEPPVVAPGSCLYLVGAPAGAPAATTEQTESGTEVLEICNSTFAHVGTNEVGPNSAEAYVMTPIGTGATACTASAWVGHSFGTAPDGGPVHGEVTVTGAIKGLVQLPSSTTIAGLARFDISLQLLDFDPVLPTPTVVNSVSIVIEPEAGNGTTIFDQPFSRRLDAVFVPGRIYGVRLRVTVRGSVTYTSDFGSPGSGNNVHYDSIEVCLDPPRDDSAITSRLDAFGDADLETKLYEKQCMPTVWMPAAQGGRLEEARTLVANLLTRAVATNDPGVNAHVAEMRLAQADASIASGQYQRACRSLSDGLRALTTP